MDRDWDWSEVLSLPPGMHPPEFMWSGDGDELDLEKRASKVRKHYNELADILDNGRGYDTWQG